jgi:hypothetical protein
MSTRITEDASGSTCAPVLRADLLARIQALNADYLDLLIAEFEAGDSHAQCFPPRFGAALAQAPRSARQRIAAVPYTLFSLCFEEARFWRTVCAAQPAPFAMRYACMSHRSARGVFCEIALLEAWHTARAQPRAAQVLHAMSPEVCGWLAGIPLWQVKRIASEYPGLLMPRWPNNPAFWPDLLRLSGALDAKRFAAAQLLGFQLIAAQLAASARCAGARGPFKPRLRPQMTPRVRVRF